METLMGDLNVLSNDLRDKSVLQFWPSVIHASVLELETRAIRRFWKISQSCGEPLLVSSPG